MLTKDKIINILNELNKGNFIFECIGPENDFVRTFISLVKHRSSLRNKKNGPGNIRYEWDKETRRRYEAFKKNCHCEWLS